MIGKHMTIRSFLQGATMVLAATLFLSSAAMAAKKEEPPQTTIDGLSLAKNTKHRLVYVADDVEFQSYTKVMIVECAVAMAKNWQRDYNRSSRDLSRKISDKDVTRIKETLATEFKKVFTQTMIDNGLEVVTEPASDVIILRPAIIDLVVNAPDTQSAGISHTYVANAGQMTLYLELYDSVSGTILGKLMDARNTRRAAPSMSYSNRVTNISAADQLLKSWANELASHFGSVTESEEEAEEESSE